MVYTKKTEIYYYLDNKIHYLYLDNEHIITIIFLSKLSHSSSVSGCVLCVCVCVCVYVCVCVRMQTVYIASL